MGEKGRSTDSAFNLLTTVAVLIGLACDSLEGLGVIPYPQ